MAKLTQAELKRYVINEVLNAAQEESVSVKEISPEGVDKLRCTLAQKFGINKNHRLSFENMAERESVQNEDGWKFISSFLKNTPHYMFFDHSWDGHGIEFSSGEKISDILGKCFGFSFYITDKENTFVIGMNDHDYLIGAGEASGWIEKLRNQI